MTEGEGEEKIERGRCEGERGWREGWRKGKREREGDYLPNTDRGERKGNWILTSCQPHRIISG